MNGILFEHSVDFRELGDTFGESPYFGREAAQYREHEHSPQANIVIARIGGAIAGALTYSIPPSDGRLKIGFVEVSDSFIGHNIGVELILEAEQANQGRYQGCVGYLNDSRNTYSRNMFLKAGYRPADLWKFYK